MSIMLENNVMEQVVSGGFLYRNKVLPSILDSKDRKMVRMAAQGEAENGSVLDPSCSSSSSSIGMNSDDDDGDVDNGIRKNNNNYEEEEVESKLKNSPIDSAVDALEQALPIRRGISKFYNGKSKSFASLADSACSSIRDITKQENAYSRKRKNLLAYSLLCDKGRTSLLKSPSIGGGIAKRPTSSNRSTLARVVAMNNCDSHSHTDENSPRSPSLSPPLTPIPPPWRSFSLVDLQHCSVTASVINSNLSRTKPDEVS